MKNASHNALLPPNTLSLFFELTGMAVQAGLPVSSACETAAETFGGARAEGTLLTLVSHVEAGLGLADAMERVPGFPGTAAAMVRIGEQTGSLDSVLLGLARHYEWEDTTRRAVRGALAYPAVLSLVMTAILAILLGQILPAFRHMFGSLGMSAQSSTAAMAIGLAVGKTALVLAAAMAVILLVLLAVLSSARRETMLARLGGATYRQFNRSRYASAMELCLSAGCSTETAASLAADSVSDKAFRARTERVTEAIGRGVSVPDALEEEGIFAPLDTKFLRFGASSGTLDSVMGRIAERCRRSAGEGLDRALGVIEPVLVTLLSVVVGGILLSVMLPLLRLLTSMG